MQTFTDKHGREWAVEVDVPLLRAVRDELGFNLLDAVDRDPALLADPVKLVDAVYLACRTQAEARKVADVEFGRSLDGPALDAAATALGMAIADWLSGDRGRAVRTALVKVTRAQQELAAAVVAKLDGA